jgi:hypothetical protein
MASLARTPRTTLLIAISVIIVIAELFANAILLASATQSASVGGWIGFSLFGIALSAVLLLVVVPRLPDENRTMAVLGFGIGAVVTCIIARTALPFALGVAAIAGAAPDDDRPEGIAPAPSTAGLLIGTLAILAAFVLCVIS